MLDGIDKDTTSMTYDQLIFQYFPRLNVKSKKVEENNFPKKIKIFLKSLTVEDFFFHFI